MKSIYLLFTYNSDDAQGGWDDFEGDYETIDEAYKCWVGSQYDSYQIVSIETMLTVSSGGTSEVGREK